MSEVKQRELQLVQPVGTWRNHTMMSDGTTKARQRPHEPEGDAWGYKQWRRRLGFHCALDVDMVEWRTEGEGEGRRLVPLAVTELTRTQSETALPQSYLDSILGRYCKGVQATAACAVAAGLGVQAYIVLYRETAGDCSEFWVYNLTRKLGWICFHPAQMVEFLRNRPPGHAVKLNP